MKKNALVLCQYTGDELNIVKNLLEQTQRVCDEFYSSAKNQTNTASVQYITLEVMLLQKAVKRFNTVFRHFVWMGEIKQLLSMYKKNVTILDGTLIISHTNSLRAKFDFQSKSGMVGLKNAESLSTDITDFLLFLTSSMTLLTKLLSQLVSIGSNIYKEICETMHKNVFTRQIFLLACVSRLHSLFMEQILQNDQLYSIIPHLVKRTPTSTQIKHYAQGKTTLIQVKPVIKEQVANTKPDWKTFVAQWPTISTLEELQNQPEKLPQQQKRKKKQGNTPNKKPKI